MDRRGFYAKSLVDVFVLFTWGMTNPLLAVALSSKIVLRALRLQYAITHSLFDELSWITNATHAKQEQILKEVFDQVHLATLEDVNLLARDISSRTGLENRFPAVASPIFKARYLLLIPVCLFLSLILIDMVGDEDLKAGIWAPILMCLLPILLAFAVDRSGLWRWCFSSK